MDSAHRGLAGIVVDDTSVSKVNPDTNSLLYRGYPVQQLAARRSVEDVAYLLWNGDLPTREQAAEFEHRERGGRALPDAVRAALDLLPVTAHPMDACRTAASVIGALHPLASDESPGAQLIKAEQLWAVFPAVVAYIQRRRRGLEPVEARSDLGYAANFLWMVTGSEQSEPVVDAFGVSMILYAEHSFNASTFTARVITSTRGDLHSAVTGAIGALKGSLHGGANEAVMHTFDEIGIRREESAEQAEARAAAWLAGELDAHHRIMGFGHRVYRHGDSRVPTMEAALERMIDHYERPELRGLYRGLAHAMHERTGIEPNLDYPAGPTYHLLGFDTEIFTPLFVASRIVGWTAHVREQAAHNALIRPLSEYVGPPEREVPER